MTSVVLISHDADSHMETGGALERVGFKVNHALTTEDGLNEIRTDGAGLVIVDISASGKDETVTAYDIRMEFPNTKIIVISANLESAPVVGADVTITKPFDRLDLVDAAKRLAESEPS
jgi:DNA-binding response OmpR family regulator